MTTFAVRRWLKHLFTRFGLPEELVTDNGPQFCSHESELFLQHHNVEHSKTAPYNSAANSMVKRLNRSLKEAIQAIRLKGLEMGEAVLTMMLSYKTGEHIDTG